MNTVNKGPVFIVGAPRSGTTLLQYMLRSHPNISMPTGESHFFIPLMKNEEVYGDLSQLENIKKVLLKMYEQGKNFLETDLHGVSFNVDLMAEKMKECKVHSMADIFNALYTFNAEGEGKSRWGDKTPYYVLHIPLLKNMFPDAQFIHIIRDGRDCALSMFDRHPDFGVINVYHAAKYWQQYVEVGEIEGNKLESKDYMSVRYEDLLVQPEESLKKVCDFLNEPYSDSLINFKKSKGEGKTHLLQKPLQKTNTNKWKEKMTPHDVKVFEGAAAETLRAHNYIIENKNYKMWAFVRIYYRGLIVLDLMKKKLVKFNNK